MQEPMRRNVSSFKNKQSEVYMRATRPFPYITITPKGTKAFKGGHPWVYEGEVINVADCLDGEICDVFSQNGTYLGSGFYNSHSLLRVRIISTNANDRFDEAFFARRINYALSYRQRVMGDDFSCCRLIFGEADRFPGLTIDRFGSFLVAEVMSLGIEKRKDMIFSLLLDNLRERGEKILGLFERSEGDLRQKEGLDNHIGWFDDGIHLVPTNTQVEIVENGVKYRVDLGLGQKTGFFLDQKYNRLAVAKLSKGLEVLDCFTHTGAFALNCLKHGAKSVHLVDASQDALNMAKLNSQLNQIAPEVITFTKADALKWLPEQVQEKAKYDLVVLDPPAFTKSRRTVKGAEKGYQNINHWGLRLVRRGGYFATASCSHFMNRKLFEKAVFQASRLAGVDLRLIEARSQAPDHPILVGVPETEYLKMNLYQVT
jgi:23S rRNA (cytosine1962-C5)-methyltransferase